MHWFNKLFLKGIMEYCIYVKTFLRFSAHAQTLWSFSVALQLSEEIFVIVFEIGLPGMNRLFYKYIQGDC